jgi:hypothetical protein
VYAVDGSAFVSSGGFNPTVTIMALALRAARKISGTGESTPLVRTGGRDLTGLAGAALAAAAAARYATTPRD